MDVILIENVDKLGRVGETVRVKNGYARNYLLPENKALRATEQNIAYFEAKRSEIEAQNNKLAAAAQKVADKINNQHLVLVRQASEDGRLYGSVSSKDIADTITAATGEAILRRHVELNTPIKNLGIYPIRIVLHGDVAAVVEINVARSDSEAAEARQAAKDEAEGKPSKKKDEATKAADANEAPAETDADVTSTEENNASGDADSADTAAA